MSYENAWMFSMVRVTFSRLRFWSYLRLMTLEMLVRVGYCNSVENYARHLAGISEGKLTECLIDYFSSDWLFAVDEIHVTCSQLQAMYSGDNACKRVLIEHGFDCPLQLIIVL